MRPDRRGAEDRVVVYLTPGHDFAEELFAAFRMRYPGIETEYFNQSGGTGFVDFLSEIENGKNRADIMLLNGLQMEVLKIRALIDKYESPESLTFPERAKDPDGYATQAWMVPFSIAYHTEKVTSDRLPVRYEDLLDPKWKGRLLYPDVHASGSGLSWFAVMKTKLGIEFFRQLAVQKIRFQRRPEEELVKGHYFILVPGMVDRIERMKGEGNPVDWIPMPMMWFGGPYAVVFRDAKHPNLGRCLVDFILSVEGQEIISRYHIPNRPNVLIREKAFRRVMEKLQGVRPISFKTAGGKDYHQNQAEALRLLLGEGDKRKKC